jgi:hypothetical protein
MTVPALARAGGLALALVACAPAVVLGRSAQQPPATAAESSRLKVFLDCRECFADYLRTEVGFVDHVRDRTEADVHVLVTAAPTAGGGREHTLTFIGRRQFEKQERTLQTVTLAADPEDVIRRQLANSLRVGLLNYVARTIVPADLSVAVSREGEPAARSAGNDRWNNWIFSVRGSASFEGEASSREMQLGGSLSADHVTPVWKITLAGNLEHESQEFDLDEDVPVRVRRREREVQGLIVRALGEHWSIGARGGVESSTFDNMRLSVTAAPAIEYNVFPYSAYTRRQLRALYAVGGEWRQYYEVTLFGRTEERFPRHSLSLTYEQRERWGSLEGRTEWSQLLHQPDKSRLEVEAEVSVRLVRGLSLGAEVTASRIGDQLSLPARGASPEEILLRLRRLRSDYEYETRLQLTYSFGSIFSRLVNPRFGR